MSLTARGERPTALQPATDVVGLVQPSELVQVRASAAARGRVSLEPARVCASCGAFPCRCRRTDDSPVPGARRLVEDCVCGGEIDALTLLPHDVSYAVQRHQVEPVHIAYDEAHGIPLSEAQMRARAIDGDPDRSELGGFG